jgi:hypothetical protein
VDVRGRNGEKAILSVHGYLKNESNMPYPSLMPALAELERLLAKHEWPWQAGHVHSLIELQDTNEAEFVRLIQDGGMSGGSGSVWEIPNIGEDTVKFREAFIELADEMERIGLGCNGSRFVGYVFRQWNESGI